MKSRKVTEFEIRTMKDPNMVKAIPLSELLYFGVPVRPNENEWKMIEQLGFEYIGYGNDDGLYHFYRRKDDAKDKE